MKSQYEFIVPETTIPSIVADQAAIIPAEVPVNVGPA